MKKDYTPKTIKAFLNNLSGFKDFKVEYIEAGVSTEVYRLTRKDKTLYFRIASKGENISSEALAHKLLLKKRSVYSKGVN